MKCKQCKKEIKERYRYYYCSKECYDLWWDKFKLPEINYKTLSLKSSNQKEKPRPKYKRYKRPVKKRTYVHKAIEDYIDYLMWVIPPSETKEIIINVL